METGESQRRKQGANQIIFLLPIFFLKKNMMIEQSIDGKPTSKKAKHKRSFKKLNAWVPWV